MPTPLNQRVRRRRDALRAAWMRRVQTRVPDTRRAGFVDECRRQSRATAPADAGDHGLDDFLDTSRTDLSDGDEA